MSEFGELKRLRGTGFSAWGESITETDEGTRVAYNLP